MDLATTLAHINTLSVEDRLRLVQAIWDGIPEDRPPHNLTDEQKNQLTSRLAELKANPEIGLTWDQLTARIRKPS